MPWICNCKVSLLQRHNCLCYGTRRERDRLCPGRSVIFWEVSSSVLQCSVPCSRRDIIDVKSQSSLRQSRTHADRTISTFPRQSIYVTGFWPRFSYIALGTKRLHRRLQRHTACCMPMVSSATVDLAIHRVADAWSSSCYRSDR